MTLVLDRRDDIDLRAAERVGWRGETVALSAAAHERMGAARAGFLRLLEQPDVVVYGVTSGYGQAAGVRFGPEERRRHAARPPWQSAAGFGEALPERVTRTIVLARLANYVEGHAAISPALARSVAGLLEGAPLPRVPVEGNGGAGEILALSALFAPLAARHRLGEKEALALINGSPCAAALAADAAIAARRRLAVVEQVFALAFEALQAPLEHLDPVLGELWGDPAEAEALASLRDLLAGAGGGRRAYQAPVSFRILPRLLGRLRRAVAGVEAVATAGLRAVTDNPVYIAPDEAHPDGRAIANGGFHDTRAGPAMDELAAAGADLCTLAERQAAKILHGPVSGLPDQLREGPLDPRYLGCLPMVQVGFAEAARRAAQRTFLPGSESGGFGQNDVAAPHFFAWRAQAETGRLLEAALAPLAMIASQAFHVTGRGVPPALADRLEAVRACAPVLTEDIHALGPDAQALAQRLRCEVLGEAGEA